LPRTEPPKFSHSSSPFLERLIERKKASLISPVLREAEREYSTLLHRVLEDRRIESTEASALLDVANHWGLSTEQVETIHLAYLSDLAGAALADGHVTEAELRELQSVSQLLGFGSLSQTQFGSLAQDPGMAQVPDKTDAADSWVGKSVCFTGECQCGLGGVPISRPRAEALARARGLVVQPSVTKKLDLLVVADPNTQSSKAKKARQYGIRVVHESVFWRNLGVTID
jgi:DNA polymerase-3 subunit epsilon